MNSFDNGKFAGDKKVGKNFLYGFEHYLVDKFTAKWPSWIQTYHLTWMTVLWSAGIVFFGYLAQDNINWLWGSSAMIVLQYISDLFDGSVGRMRNTGLVRWGYYMDHFLDYVFVCALLISYFFVTPDSFATMLFFILALCSAYLVNSYLSFSASNKFRVSYYKIGPTEMRIVFIVINTLLIMFGTTYSGQLLPWILGAITFALFMVVYRTQKELWKIDMEEKAKNEHGPQ
ncbi:MAG: CDP-alcohol phosphatidyltransferase family protein [Candidatus Kerfeldbacteria bacterium]